MIDIINEYGVMLMVGQFPNGPLGGLALTIVLAVTSLLVSFPLAICIGLARTSKIKAIYQVAAAYTYVVRAVPLVLLVFWAYFVVPLVTGYNISGFVTMVVALVLYEGAYLGEVIRAGIDSVNKGQTEAARALGMTYWQCMRKIILPQALFNMIPSILNQFVLITKNTSLAYLIGTQEVTFAAYQINNQLLTKPFQVYILLALCYFVLCFSLSRMAKWLEGYIGRKRSGVGRQSQNNIDTPVHLEASK
ncbi:amino acid ABC transporter permease [Pseudomonas shirazica]|uniref:amino acid ABC transporter permease n=1 Tax=Pseudomonas sp. LRP2-20 TaxID=2944234 RepID=UPI0021896BE3|nr:amino acid ABC transporter permease [Pseudomonas sp. LRP2-20]UQB79393.1 amino acid ABC transporter permease [Pseudomonas shirazica]BDM22271.1 amino acid ABC transporter permease [Pseudomonas sp. LRP2-20]